MFYYSPSVKINKGKDKNGKDYKKGRRATVYYKDQITGKVKQKTKMLPEATGKKDAERLAQIWCEELNNIKETAPIEPQIKSVAEIIQEYEDNRLATGQIEKSTYKRDLLITKNYINPYLGNYVFTSVERTDLTKWVSELYKKYSQTTTRNAYTQLKKVYTYYYDFEMPELGTNPFKGVKAPKQGKPKKTHLSKEQQDDFLMAVYTEYEPTEPMYCGLLLAYYGGLRRGEICALRWRNIDFDKETITVDSSIGYGKGGNYTQPPKTDSSNRTFPMLPQLYEALKTRYDYLKPKNNWFVIGKEDKFMSLQAYTANFQKLADDYGLKDYYGKRITPHGLRHNLATVGINSGMDIASLSKMMGHASRAMTLDIYGDANPDALKTASQKLSLTFDDMSQMGESEEVAEKLYAFEEKLGGKK